MISISLQENNMSMPLHDCRLPDGVLLHVEYGLQGGAVRRHLQGEVALAQQDAAPFAAAAFPGGELEGDAGGVVVGGVDEGGEAVARKGGGACAGGKLDDCTRVRESYKHSPQGGISAQKVWLR